MPKLFSLRYAFFIFGVTLALAACSKKSTPAPPLSNQQLIVGKWFTVADTTKEYQNNIQVPCQTEYVNTDYKQFNADSTGTETVRGAFYHFKWQLYYYNPGRGLLLFLTQYYASQTVNGIVMPAFTRDLEVISLTAKNFHLFTDDETSGTYGGQVEFTDENYLLKQ